MDQTVGFSEYNTHTHIMIMYPVKDPDVKEIFLYLKREERGR